MSWTRPLVVALERKGTRVVRPGWRISPVLTGTQVRLYDGTYFRPWLVRLYSLRNMRMLDNPRSKVKVYRLARR